MAESSIAVALNIPLSVDFPYFLCPSLFFNTDSTGNTKLMFRFCMSYSNYSIATCVYIFVLISENVLLFDG